MIISIIGLIGALVITVITRGADEDDLRLLHLGAGYSAIASAIAVIAYSVGADVVGNALMLTTAWPNGIAWLFMAVGTVMHISGR